MNSNTQYELYKWIGIAIVTIISLAITYITHNVL